MHSKNQGRACRYVIACMLAAVIGCGRQDATPRGPLTDALLIGSESERRPEDQVAALHTRLLARLDSGDSIDNMVAREFQITSRDSTVYRAAPSRNAEVAVTKLAGLRIPIDTVLVRIAGPLREYRDLEVLKFSEDQLFVLARSKNSSVLVLSNWFHSSSGWQALSVVVAPDAEFVDRIQKEARRIRAGG